MTRSKLEFWVLLFIGIISGAFIGIVAFKYILPLVSPFLISWLVAMATRTSADKLSQRMHIPKRILRLFISLSVTLIAFGLLALALWQGTAAVWRLLSDIDNDDFLGMLEALSTPSSVLGIEMPPELASRFESAVSEMISAALSFVATAVTSWIGFVPKALLFILVTVISLIYFSLDLERINSFVKSLLPAKATERIVNIKRRFFEICKKYLRSYVLLMLITFGVLLSGMLLIGVRHALVTAAVISLLDVLPIIGVGTVLVPWSILAFIGGDTSLGIGLVILFAVNTVVRQLAEPKIVGKSLDMHPIVTLVMLYAGYSLLGIAGLLLIPLAAVAFGVIFDHRGGTRVSQ